MSGYLFLVFIVVVFIATVLLVQGLYSMWNTYRGPEARKIEERLRSVAASSNLSAKSQLVKERLMQELPALDRMLMRLPRATTFDRTLVHAGLGWSVSRFLILSALFVLGAIGLCFIANVQLLAAVPICVASGSLPLLFVLRRRNQRVRVLEEQLPEALDFLSRAMRAGHSFSSGMSVVGDEGPSKIRGEFKTTFDEINYGIPVDEALINLVDRVPTTDMRFFAAAVLLQRETGGNLAEILGNLSRLIRERLKLYGKVRVLAAEGKLSAWILTLLPFCTTGLILLVNPEFMSTLWTDAIGPKLIATNAAMMIVGIFWMWRIVKIRV